MAVSRVRAVSVPWDSQPQEVVGIDLTNPLAAGVVIAVSGAAPDRNLVDGKQFTAANSVGQLSGPAGLGLTWPSTAFIGARVNSSTALTNGFALSGKGVSILVVANPVSSATRSFLFASVKAAQPEFYVGVNCDKALTATAGMFSVSTHGSNGANVAGAVDGKTHVYVVTFATPASAPNAYVDGVELGTSKTPSSTADLSDSGCSDYVGGYISTGWTVSGYSEFLCIAANREWTAAEVAQLSQNPWQLFEPRQQLVPVVSSVSAWWPGTESTLNGWTASNGGTLASCISETSFSDAEWIEGPVGSNTPDFPWAPSSLPAGNYDFPVRAYKPGASGQIRSVFLDGPGGTALATGAWHALTGGYANYSDNLTIAATSTHFRLETQA